VVDGNLEEPGQITMVQGAVGDPLEDGVGTEGVVVALVLVAGEHAVDPGPDHLREGGFGQVGVAGAVEGAGVGPRQADALVELADREQSGVTGPLARGRLDHERCAKEMEDLRPGEW
jgi:hypothetical protein